MQSLVGFLLIAIGVTALPSPKAGKQGGLSKFTVRQDVTATENRIIPVIVGGPQDLFIPNIVTAAVGDVIQFQFSNGNHTVTQSAADTPCQPLQATVATAIHSGHIPFEDGQTTVGTFNMPVTTADTMFLYCATGPHCQEGQVMIVNPTDDQQILDYANLAATSGQSGDGTAVVGGTVASIPLEVAAFVPAPVGEAGPPGPPADAAPIAEEPVAEAPPAEAPLAEEPVAEEPVAEAPVAEVPVAEAPAAEVPGTTTTTLTVQPEATPAPVA
ncbi:hypothetical protein F5X99DRAFT_340273 [Biscogniauxia marginata]|nr:hypothetical protein F5X99DRAFT_340273 [Biscogniauxia marginata]